jgi:flagellar assembly factor FliW
MVRPLIEDISLESLCDKIIEFSDGLPGFPANRKFVMLQKPEERPFVWLQSLSGPLSFALVDAYAWAEDYELEVDDDELERLGSLDPLDYAVYLIVRIEKEKNRTTLRAKADAPVLVNVRTRRARQVTVSAKVAGKSAEALCLKL